MADLYTISQVAERFGVTTRQVDHATRTRGVGFERVALTRVWPESAMPAMEQALRDTGAIARAKSTQHARKSAW